jgi:PiT family inorganic phosphate transporter
MGVIAALLVGAGYVDVTAGSDKLPVPEWAALASYTAIALGTAWGGWKIIDTMGLRLTRLNARTGVAANIGATTAIFGATHLGIPISTTHAAASSVVGAGIAGRRGTNWKVIGEMVTAWVATIPATAALSWLVYRATQLPTVLADLAVGSAVVALLTAIVWAMAHAMGAKEIEAEVLSTAIPADAGPRADPSTVAPVVDQPSEEPSGQSSEEPSEQSSEEPSEQSQDAANAVPVTPAEPAAPVRVA